MFSILPTSLLFTILPLLVLSSPTNLPSSSGLSQCLQSAGLQPITASNENYTADTAAYNQRLQPEPYAILFPTTSEEVAIAVGCARSNGFKVAARGGGHSYASYGLGEDNGLVIALSSFNSISQIEGTDNYKVGGGVKLGDLAIALNDNGHGFGHGTCPFVGIGGHASYGGFGLSSRMWGLSLDSVIGYDVVLANSTVIYNLTSEIDADLFWALRGAGPNYGVITAFYIKTYQAPSSAINFAYSWNSLSVEDATRNFLAFQNFGNTSAPSTLGISVVLGSGGSFEINGVSYSTLDEFKNTIQPLLDQVTGGYSTDIKSFTWIESLAALAGNQALSTFGASDNRDDFFAKSLMTPMATALTKEALNAYFTYLQDTQTDTAWFVEVNVYGGANSAINAVTLSESSFAHRNSLLNFQMYASSSNYSPPYPSSGIDFVNGMYNSIVNVMLPLWYENYGSYVNYVDPTLDFNQVIAFYWGSQYPRLSSLRGKYDPEEVFKNPQSIKSPERWFSS